MTLSQDNAEAELAGNIKRWTHICHDFNNVLTGSYRGVHRHRMDRKADYRKF